MPRSRNTERAALAFTVVAAGLAMAACGDAATPAAVTTPPASASAPASPTAGSASTADGALTATSTPASSPTETTPTTPAGTGGKKVCGAVRDLPDFKLVVSGVSCADGTKVLWAYFKQGAYVNQRGGALEQSGGWSCIFSRTVHATVATSDGFSCWHGSDTAQLLDPKDPQVGGSGPK